MDIKTLSIEDIKALRATKRAEALALVAGDDVTEENFAAAQALQVEIAELTAEEARKVALAAMRDEFAVTDPEPEEEPVVEEPEEDEEVEASVVEPEVEPVVEAPVEASGGVVALASRTARPVAPSTTIRRNPVTITAAADSGFAAGQDLDGTLEIGQALTNRIKGLPKFNAQAGRAAHNKSGGEPVLNMSSIATIQLSFDESNTVSKGMSEDQAMSIMAEAGKEANLPGGALTAAGWCAPSETIYDLCEGETLDGIVSVPEINVQRGGIRYTTGPMFSDFYSGGFFQTEAQAINGDEKTCSTVTCPSFTDVRLGAIGVCITTPILTEVGYPELTQRFVNGSLNAHQHRVNFRVLTAIEAGSTAQNPALDFGSTAFDTLDGLELVAMGRREKFRLGISASMEVVLPHWIKGALRADIAKRDGVALQQVTDTVLDSFFRARNLNVQWAYDWQPLGAEGTDGTPAYPTTYKALMYPAGTWVKGVSDVINLSAVYDAASLEVNNYTGLFMEQGLLVAKMCYDSDVLTLPVCNAGRQGALNFTCA